MDDDATTVTLTATELKPSTMDQLVKDMHIKFTMFKSLTKMWQETKIVPNHKQYMFILQLLGKDGLCHWESLLLATPHN